MKHRTALPMLIRLSADGEPPTEFRLFKLGPNDTTKGTFTLDPEDAQACLEAQEAYGNDLSIDWGHGAFEEAEGAPQRAAGWISGLELRADGLWAIGVSWTETAAGMLKRREQRYFSPAFNADKTRHIRSIINCALTLIPATHGLIPLVASRAGNRGVAARKLNRMKTKYLKASALMALADEMDKDESASDEKKEMSAALRKMAEEQGEELKLADDSEPDGDEGKQSKTSEGGDEEKTSEGEPDGDEEKQQTSRIVATAREITGQTTAAGIVGALKAMGEGTAGYAKLAREVAELKASGRAAEVKEIISKASQSGKVAPAMVAKLTAMGMRDPAELKGFIDVLPVLVSMKDGKAVEASQAAPESMPVQLSQEQLAILRKAGVHDTAAFAASLSGKAGKLGIDHGTFVRSSHREARCWSSPRAAHAACQGVRHYLRGLARRAPGGLCQARRDRHRLDRCRPRRGAGGQQRRQRWRPHRQRAPRSVLLRQQRHEHRPR
jgi:phage I-like protein